jgi:hypothetical protein
MENEVRVNTDTRVTPEIFKLAGDVLRKETMEEIEFIFTFAFSKDVNKQKISGDFLASLIPDWPKRPLYYVNHEVSLGPRMYTRYVVNYLCAFLNVLLDDCVKDFGGFKKFMPFGRALNKLKGKISEELFNQLDRYNKVFYRPAKHDFELFRVDGHLFSLKDAIYCCFITMKLKDEILEISNSARDLMDINSDFWKKILSR